MAEECLFRNQHVVTLGRPPKNWLDKPEMSHLLTEIYVSQNRVNSRRAGTADERRAFGWRAMYWLMEHILFGYGTPCMLFGDVREIALWIMGESDFFGESQTEFLRHFKIHAMQASAETFARLFKDPTPLVRRDEVFHLPGPECKALYDRVAAEMDAKIGAGGKPGK